MQKHYYFAKLLAYALDNGIKIGPWSFGLDPIIGLIPELGDVIGAVLGFYIVWVAIKMKVPDKKVKQMIRNVILDLVLGLIPVIGDAADFAFKSNAINWQILEQNATDINAELIPETN